MDNLPIKDVTTSKQMKAEQCARVPNSRQPRASTHLCGSSGKWNQFINIEVFPVIAAADAYDQRQVFEASLSLEGN
jgi:hypothetical protein